MTEIIYKNSGALYTITYLALIVIGASILL